MPDPDATQQYDDTDSSVPDPSLPLDENLDVEELMALGAVSAAEPAFVAVPAEDVPDDDDEADEDDEDEADQPSESGAAEAATAPTQAGDRPALDPVAAGAMLAETPQRINELPRRQRAPAVEEAMRLAYVRGVADMGRRMTDVQQQETELRAFYDVHAQERSEDPEAFAAWEDEQPEEAARFAQARAYFTAKAAGKPAALPGMRQSAPAPRPNQLTEAQLAIQEVANLEGERFAALPLAAQQAIATKGFPLTAAGLATFRAAISEAEAAARKGTNVSGDALARQESARVRAGTARVDVGTRGNASTPKKNPLADIDDVDALMEMAVSGAQARRRG
jgi:hypothetical protein